MRKIGIGLIALMLLSLTSVLGSTTIWGQISNSGGITEYSEMTSVGGYDWSERAYVTTGVLEFAANNDGQFQLSTYVNQPNSWELEKYETAVGNGETELFKQMVVWTEDTTLWENGHPAYRNPDGQAGELAYPTEAYVSTMFVTPVPFYDLEEAHYLMKDAPAETNLGTFTKLIHSNDAFNFEAAQGVNLEPCNFVEMPEFEPFELCKEDC